jgi:hypothetical protein
MGRIWPKDPRLRWQRAWTQDVFVAKLQVRFPDQISS